MQSPEIIWKDYLLTKVKSYKFEVCLQKKIGPVAARPVYIAESAVLQFKVRLDKLVSLASLDRN